MPNEPEQTPAIAVLLTPEFRRNLRQLAKKYRHIKSDVQPLLDLLGQGQTPGDQITGVQREVFKVRLRNSDSGKGKSGGYRVIYQRLTEGSIVLVTIYSKTEQGDVAAQEIRQIILNYETRQKTEGDSDSSHPPQEETSNLLYITVDLGAGSGRVFLAGVAPGELLLEEIRRFHYPPSRRDGHLRWDLTRIFSEIKTGLREVGERARQLGRPVHSVGVDSWGVDYGLIDAAGNIVEDPVCYRDERTAGVMEQVFARLPREEIYARTGIQFLNFNTVFQLFAHAQVGIPAKAERMLLIPDLINFLLTERSVTEYTNATTTQLVNAADRAWDDRLIEGLGLPARLFAEIVPAGAGLGWLRPELAEELNLRDARVVAPATHDTGSAVAGAPLEDGWAYISSGTWSLVGVELDRPLINAETALHNFTNEGGAFGTIRFLKNVMGLWVLESCRREWRERGLAVDYDALLGDVAARDDFPALIYPDDARLFNPPSMTAAIAEQLAETGQPAADEPAAITKTILDSLALRYASIIRTIERLTGKTIKGAQIVGGGSQNNYLNQATANATGKPVLAGPVEATVIGNALVQAIAAGRFATLAEARRHVAENVSQRRFEPQPLPGWDDAAQRYANIDAQWQ